MKKLMRALVLLVLAAMVALSVPSVRDKVEQQLYPLSLIHISEPTRPHD